MAGRVQTDDLGRAKQLTEGSLELYRALGDRWGMGRALERLEVVRWRQGALEEAKRLAEETVSLLQALGDRREMLGPLERLSYDLGELGQPGEAERVAREAIAVAHQVGDPVTIEWANYYLCDALRYGGRFAEARAPLERILTTFRERGAHNREPWGRWQLALTSRHLGCYREARTAARESLTLFRESGARSLTANCQMEMGRLALAEGAYGEAQEWLQQSIATYHQVRGMLWRESKALAALAHADRGLGQAVQARRHLAAALRIAADIHGHNAALNALPAAALLLVDAGEVERAVEVYALASRYPFVANSCWFEDIAGKHIASASTALSPQAVDAAVERGRARDLWTTMEGLLAEFAGSETGD